jgi:hypothetical protein
MDNPAMGQKTMGMKNILLITNKESGEVLPYSTLSPFLRDYPQYEKRIDSINGYLSRKKTAFEDEFFKIERKEVVR